MAKRVRAGPYCRNLIMDAPTHGLFFILFYNMAKQNLPPVKVAILIDGGFFIKRFNTLYNSDRKMSGADVANLCILWHISM